MSGPPPEWFVGAGEFDRALFAAKLLRVSSNQCLNMNNNLGHAESCRSGRHFPVTHSRDMVGPMQSST